MNSDFASPYLADETNHFDHPKATLIANVLRGYNLKVVVAQVAGLMTVPCYQSNSYRLELLAQIAVARCAGDKLPTWRLLSDWLNRHLGHKDIACMEDPAEDAFVTNVITSFGDYKVLGGLWESADAATTLLMEAVCGESGEIREACFGPAIALLRLSNAILDRADLRRWDMENSLPKGVVRIAPADPLDSWADRVIFSNAALEQYSIDPIDLSHFILDLENRSHLLEQRNQQSNLHRYPILRVGDELVVALPNALTYAVRMFVIESASSASTLDRLNAKLMSCVMRRLVRSVRHSSRHSVNPVSLPENLRGVAGTCQSILVRVGLRRFLHFVVVSDDLHQLRDFGFIEPSEISPSQEAAVLDHMYAVRNFTENSFEVDAAHTFLVMGHLGQAFGAEPPSESELWTFGAARLSDLEMLLTDADGPADRLLLLLSQEKALEIQGLALPNQNGLLNLYAFWEQHGFYLRIDDAPHDRPAYVQISTDFVAKFRLRRRRTVDEHCEPSLAKPVVVVHRATHQSVYRSMQLIPAYVSMDHLIGGILSFCLTNGGNVIWLTFLSANDRSARDATFKLWEAFPILVHRFLERFGHLLTFPFAVIEVVVDLSFVKRQSALIESDGENDLVVAAAPSSPRSRIVAEKNFLNTFSSRSNMGERKLLAAIILAMARQTNVDDRLKLDPELEALRVLGGDEARVLHAFQMQTEVEFLLASSKEPIYSAPTEHIKSNSRMAFTFAPSVRMKTPLGQSASVEILNAAVLRKCLEICSLLKRFNRRQIINSLMAIHESLLRERRRWQTTARAVRALYGLAEGTGAAQEMEREFAQLKISVRSLIEAAICESPLEAGASPDPYSIDLLVGTMAVLIDLGRESDVVFYGLAPAGIALLPSGAYELDASQLVQLASPYMKEAFEQNYAAAADNYDNLVGAPKVASEEPEPSLFSSTRLEEAWYAEYELSFVSFQEICGALQDMAVSRQAVIVETSVAEVTNCCASRGVSREDIEAFLKNFALAPRSQWMANSAEVPPRDIKPWRFQRRNSISLRPIVLLSGGANSDAFLFGAGTLRQSLAYVLDCINDATFDKDVFRSKKMRALLGMRTDELGRGFTEEVASVLRKLGWSTETEVKLTRLGAAKEPNLGDIDVLAWQANGRVLAIECKRLKFSKSVAEIAQSCSRFKGNSGDHLYKHLRRIGWLQSNISALSAFLKLSGVGVSLRAPLVVNAPVPFKYLKGLPLPAGDIVVLESLAQYCSAFK